MTTRILAIDPGQERSGWVYYDGVKPLQRGWDDNPLVRAAIKAPPYAAEPTDWLVIERVSHYGSGMAVGRSVFDTCEWIGRFKEAFGIEDRIADVTRPEVRIHLCGTAKARDTNIRQALIDRWGGKFAAIGNVRCKACNGKGWRGLGRPVCKVCSGSGCKHLPGPLHGITSHVWAALGVAVTWWDKEKTDAGPAPKAVIPSLGRTEQPPETDE